MTKVEHTSLDILTARERKFVEGICAGMSGVEAARYCGSKASDRKGLAVYASKLKAKTSIKEAIVALRKEYEIDAEALWAETQKALRELIRDRANPNARARACELMARLLGKLQPEKHQHVHAHAHFDLPSGPEGRAEIVRLIRVALRPLPEDERAAVLRELLEEDET